MFEGLRKPTEVIVAVVTFLAYGCSIQAIVQAFGLDERTVASWRDRAGTHWKPGPSGGGATRATGPNAGASPMRAG